MNSLNPVLTFIERKIKYEGVKNIFYKRPTRLLQVEAIKSDTKLFVLI